jgi:hypothetical protein
MQETLLSMVEKQNLKVLQLRVPGKCLKMLFGFDGRNVNNAG